MAKCVNPQRQSKLPEDHWGREPEAGAQEAAAGSQEYFPRRHLARG